MLKPFIFLIAFFISSLTLPAQETIVQYLSGTDKDHTVSWQFMCTAGRNSGKWSTIPVPSCWEMQGFGTYNYFEDKVNPDEKGLYRHSFTVAPKYKGQKVFLVFDGSMTDTEVKVNGSLAGPIHQGGFYQFKYDITDLVKTGAPNLLEVTVSKRSANASINRAERQADFWMFSGIFRPVFLQIQPPVFIERVAIDARANGTFAMQVFSNASNKYAVEAQVTDLQGKSVESAFALTPGDSMLHHQFKSVTPWNPEQPKLYNVQVRIKEGAKTLHTITQRFGFRTAELRPQDGFYVNGKKVVFKGVCRHSQWPESGRTLNRKIHLLDIATMKGMNMNAVRMSHYPPDREFLDLCDSLGLFVLDELTGWQKAYDTIVGRRLVKELVIRDVNHPSIVIWDNGNEGGWNRALDDDYALYDPQKRHVIHPWERFKGTNTKHYPDFKYVQNEVANPKEVFFPTEFMHGLFDGGHGAALEDFWNEMRKHPYNAGGFLWALHDEGVVRGDRNDSIDVAGNFAPDGIVGPYRQREASYYSIREIWSPVYIDRQPLAIDFDGRIPVENRYTYSTFKNIKFNWQWVTFPTANQNTTAGTTVLRGIAQIPQLEPGQQGFIKVGLPPGNKASALYVTATNAKGDTICAWSWPVKTPATTVGNFPASVVKSKVAVKQSEQSLGIMVDGVTYYFDKKTGYLQKVNARGRQVSLHGGPALAGVNNVLSSFESFRKGDTYVVQPKYKGDSIMVSWTFESGKLPMLEYTITPRDTADFTGITFNYPEENIKRMKWLGRGPYTVWKNRLRGQQLGVWQKEYNNTIAGQDWRYPPFKGWHDELYWMQLQNTEGNFTVYAAEPGMYLQMLKPQKPAAAGNNNTSPSFPAGDIGFMHAISAIGTKFQKAEIMGPQSQKNVYAPGTKLHSVLYFSFW